MLCRDSDHRGHPLNLLSGVPPVADTKGSITERRFAPPCRSFWQVLLIPESGRRREQVGMSGSVWVRPLRDKGTSSWKQRTQDLLPDQGLLASRRSVRASEL